MVITTLAFNTSAQSPDSWVQKNSLPATARATSFAFSIGDKGYVGGGLNFGAGGSLKDFWEYDPAADSWTQKANYGGGVCSGAVAFAIGDKGYALTGSGNLGKKKDIWEYDPLLNSWTQKTDLPATERNYAVAFALGTKGYLGTGYTSAGFVSLNDFWQFDPVANVWTQKANFGGGVDGRHQVHDELGRQHVAALGIGQRDGAGTAVDGAADLGHHGRGPYRAQVAGELRLRCGSPRRRPGASAVCDAGPWRPGR